MQPWLLRSEKMLGVRVSTDELTDVSEKMKSHLYKFQCKNTNLSIVIDIKYNFVTMTCTFHYSCFCNENNK